MDRASRPGNTACPAAWGGVAGLLESNCGGECGITQCQSDDDRDAGFHCSRLWNCTTPSAKLRIYKKTAGLEGLFGCGKSIQQCYPPQLDTITVRNEEELFEHFLRVKLNPRSPIFVDFELITLGFYKKDGGYSAIKRQVDRLDAAYPGRYVFLLPKDQIATIQACYHVTDRQ